jgi:hypothetical protein
MLISPVTKDETAEPAAINIGAVSFILLKNVAPPLSP